MADFAPLAGVIRAKVQHDLALTISSGGLRLCFEVFVHEISPCHDQLLISDNLQLVT
jgi:hypothetical protein